MCTLYSQVSAITGQLYTYVQHSADEVGTSVSSESLHNALRPGVIATVNDSGADVSCSDDKKLTIVDNVITKRDKARQTKTGATTKNF